MEYLRGNVCGVEVWDCRHSVRARMPGLSLVSDVNAQGGGIVGRRNGNGTEIGHAGIFVLLLPGRFEGRQTVYYKHDLA